MSKPVIIHCINSLGIGGAEILLRDTINLLPEYKHVICYLNKPQSLLSSFKEHTTYNLNHQSWIDTLRTVARLRKIISLCKPKLIHAHLFDSTLLARLACPSSVKFVFTVHNILSRDAFDINKISLVAERLTYKKSQVLIAVSKLALDDYNRRIGVKGKCFVLYNYVNEKYFDLEYDTNRKIDQGIKLVAAGNLRRQKNYFILIEALALLSNKNVTLDIYGEGDLREELQKKIEQNNAPVRLMGRVEDMSQILMKYDAYIMPSLFEGFGLAPMEAIAAGMPVLLSQLPVFEELNGDIPTYFDPLDACSIAGSIESCMSNWEDIKLKARNGKRLIFEKASKERYITSLRNIYNESNSK